MIRLYVNNWRDAQIYWIENYQSYFDYSLSVDK